MGQEKHVNLLRIFGIFLGGLVNDIHEIYFEFEFTRCVQYDVSSTLFIGFVTSIHPKWLGKIFVINTSVGF